MAADLLPETLNKIEALIGKSLGARQEFRQHGNPFDPKHVAKVWKPLLDSVVLFPDRTIKHNPDLNLEPYGEDLLRMQTEVIWAFSSGARTEDLDCPQRAADFYHFFTDDLYNWYLNTDTMSGAASRVVSLYRDVTNDKADWSLITQDKTPREGMVNSPRAAIAAFAFIVTNAMTSDKEIVEKVEKMWVERCGKFTVIQN